MIEVVKYHYSKVIDKACLSIDALRPYLEKARSMILSFSFRLAIVVIAIMIAMWSGKYVWKYMASQNTFVVSPITFSFEAPEWATDELINEIENIPGLKREYSMFEKDLTSKIAGLYEKNPLISKVYYVERELPNRINIKLELRRPIAIVKRKNREYLVDKDCVRLPAEFYKYPLEDKDAVYIINRRRFKVVEHGEKWDNNAIREGINLLNYLKYNRIDKLLDIGVFDVSNIRKRAKRGKNDINLWTRKGALVKWGCVPSSEKPDELSNHEKLQNLLSVVNEEGTSLAKMEYVDVRWKVPIGKHINFQ